MKFKEILITTFLTLIVLALFGCNYFANKFILKAQSIYEVFLNGSVIGYIEDENQLYKLINNKQKEIRKKYNVENVYPPENFNIIKTNSYNVTISSVEDIYNKMAKLDSFTIEGYEIKFAPSEESGKKSFSINSINKEIFDTAIKNFILAFIDEEQYNNYINQTQPKIEGTGSLIELMAFDESITIKKSLINVNDKIFTKEEDLSRYLLFGDDNEVNYYTVQEGDTIPSICDNNKLNTIEFLVANPQYNDEDILLKIGDSVDVSLINPQLTFSYDVNEVYDMTIPFEKKINYDESKPFSYAQVTTPGVNGLTRVNSEYKVINGEKQSGVYIIASEELVAKVDEVTTRGTQGYSGGSGSYIDTGQTWGWPTNTPYIITSYFGWRWGAMHNGIDISGTGYGSPIYAVLDGEVVAAGNGGMVGWQCGWNVVIKHDNGYYTDYCHMVPHGPTVKVGDRVKRGQVIGSMGMSGIATGTHLHLGISNGIPYGGGTFVNPCRIYEGRC